jgi:hypothetical protein
MRNAKILNYARGASASIILHSAMVPCWHWSMSCRSSAPSAVKFASLRATQMSACDPVNLRAWLTSVVRQAQQFADVVERETKGAATADAAQAGKMALGISPVIAASPRWGKRL